MEAPIGIEPMNNGFAIRSLSHLGTAPLVRNPHLNTLNFRLQVKNSRGLAPIRATRH